MAFRLSWFTSAVLFLFSVSSGETSVNMCENGTTRIDDDNLELDAFGPSPSLFTTNISRTCSCSINTTYSVNIVYFQFSRETEPADRGCRKNIYDEATLDNKDETNMRSYTIQNENISNFYGRYDNISPIRLNITIHSICGSNYTIRLTQTYYPRNNKFSHVTCISPHTFIAPSVTTTSSTALKPTHVSKNDRSSTYSPEESSSAGSVDKNNAPSPSQIGLIVGVVVGVGGCLLLLGAIILAVFIFRRRRAKPQPLTSVQHDAPPANPYELPESRMPVSYEHLNSSTQLQTGILYDNQNSSTQLENGIFYDNQNAATDPLATETNQNYYSVQGIDNSASYEEVDNFIEEPHSINDTDTTVIENDLYGK